MRIGIFSGTSVLANDPAHRLRAKIDPSTGKLDIRTIPSSHPQQMPDGTTAKRLLLDERDIDGLDEIIQKIRRRNNLSPLSPEEINKLKQNARDNLAVIENPDAIVNIRIDTHRFMRGIVKICYELAFLWLGEGYLEDKVAVDTRNYLKSIMTDGQLDPDLPMEGTVTSDIIPPLEMWSPNKNYHIAYASPVSDHIGISIKIFDVFYAVLFVSKNAGRYIPKGINDEKLRFLVIDPVTQRMLETSFIDEMGRIARAMIHR